jgi:hypothetical protein
MTNERLILFDIEATGGDGCAVRLPGGTRVVVLMAPLHTTEGDIAFVVSGKRYQMPLARFLEATADVMDEDTVRPGTLEHEPRTLPNSPPKSSSGGMTGQFVGPVPASPGTLPDFGKAVSYRRGIGSLPSHS